MDIKKTKSNSIAAHRKYLHKMDRQFFFIRLTMKYAMANYYFVPTMDKDAALECNVHTYMNLYPLLEKTIELRDLAKEELISLSNGLPIGCKIDGFLNKLMHSLFFNNVLRNFTP